MNNMYDFEKIAQRIKAVRIDKNITQAYVSKKCNVSRSTVIKWEKGESFPELNSMLKLCNLYDCELGYLLCEPGYENGTREITDICKATGLSQEAVKTLVEHETYTRERPHLSHITRKEKLLINTLLMKSNNNFIVSLNEYASFECQRLALSKLFDLNILNINGKITHRTFNEWTAISIAKLLINKKIPLINKELSDSSCFETGEEIYDNMVLLINSMYEERENRITSGKDTTGFEYFNDILGYKFSEDEKITLCCLFENYGEVLKDPSGKINQFVIVEMFKDFLSGNIENIHGGFLDD